MFVRTVREALLSVDPDVIFVDSSPSKGVLSQAPYVKRCGLLAVLRMQVQPERYSSCATLPPQLPLSASPIYQRCAPCRCSTPCAGRAAMLHLCAQLCGDSSVA